MHQPYRVCAQEIRRMSPLAANVYLDIGGDRAILANREGIFAALSVCPAYSRNSIGVIPDRYPEPCGYHFPQSVPRGLRHVGVPTIHIVLNGCWRRRS